MAGKGSKPRPFNVPKEDFDKSFESIFGKYIPPYLRTRTEDKEEKSVDDKTDDK
jgi:hypothetical protein